MKIFFRFITWPVRLSLLCQVLFPELKIAPLYFRSRQPTPSNKELRPLVLSGARLRIYPQLATPFLHISKYFSPRLFLKLTHHFSDDTFDIFDFILLFPTHKIQSRVTRSSDYRFAISLQFRHCSEATERECSATLNMCVGGFGYIKKLRIP